MQKWSMLFVAVTCVSCSTLTEQPPSRPLSGDPGADVENPVGSGTFAPGESRRYTIHTKKTILIGFNADVPKDAYDRYIGKPGPHIMIHHVGKSKTLGSIQGAGLEFDPVDGKIEISVENGLDIPVKISVYWKRM